MIYAGLNLARRIEAAEARNGVGCAEAHQRLNPGLGAAVLEVGGGFAIYVGVESPLTHAVGLGMHGPLRTEDMDWIEEFYRARGAAVSVELCPLADVSVIDLLGDRGYQLTEFNNVLVRPLAETAPGSSGAVRRACANEERLWAHTVGCGFLEKDELNAEEVEVGRAIWHMPDAHCFLAFSNDRTAAGAAMSMHAGLATLFADATLLGYRGAGWQSALIRERLCAAIAAGCDLATATTMPGGVSQRNYERNGFHVAYTKAVLVR